MEYSRDSRVSTILGRADFGCLIEVDVIGWSEKGSFRSRNNGEQFQYDRII